MVTRTTPETIAFTYVEQNIGPNYRISEVTAEKNNIRVTFDGFFTGKCPTCGRQIEQRVEKVFSVLVRKKDFMIIEKPNLNELKDKVVRAGLAFLLNLKP